MFELPGRWIGRLSRLRGAQFRGVLYLDVFGCLSSEGESPRRAQPAPGPSSQALPPAIHVAVADDCLRKKAGDVFSEHDFASF